MSNMSTESDVQSPESFGISRRGFLSKTATALLAGSGIAAAVSACGGSNGESGTSGSQQAASASSSGGSASASSSGGAAGDPVKTITIHPVGNQMKFKETEITVPAGKPVKIIFDNTATSPSMQHNVVFLNSNDDEDVKRVGEAGMTAGANNAYVPDDPAVLAHTPLAKPGETVEVTFTTPSEAGDYRYVCTFPGHWATMQGTMHVSG